MQAHLNALRDYVNALRRRPLRDWITYEFSVAEGAAVFMLAYLGSAVLGIIRQVVFNARFGVSMEASAYYAAARLPDTFGLLVGGGVLANAMVPVLVRVYQRTGSNAAISKLMGSVLSALLVLVIPLALLVALFAPWLVTRLIAPGFDPPTAELTVLLTRFMLLEVILLTIEGILIAVLLSRRQIFLPALSLIARNVALISGIGLATIFPSLGVYAAVGGALCDALLQIAIMLPGLRRANLQLRLVWAWGDHDLRDTLRLMVPSGLASVTNYAGNLVDTAFATLAREAGTLAALANASMLLGVPTRLLGVAIGQSLLPHVAKYYAEQRIAELQREIRRGLLIAGSLALIAAALGIGLGRWGIKIIFERGAFDAAAGDLTYTIMAMLAVSLPASILTEVISRSLVALHDTRTNFLANLLQLFIRLAILIPSVPVVGAIAIPAATAITTGIETGILASVLWWRLRKIATQAAANPAH